MKPAIFLSALSLVAILSSSALAKDLNLPVVSKGYQHEFWQTVKWGRKLPQKSWVHKTRLCWSLLDETQIAEQIQLVENTRQKAKRPVAGPRLMQRPLALLVETANSRDQGGDLRLGREPDIPGQLCRHQ